MTPEVTLLRPATHGSQACGRLYGFQNEEAQISWLSAQIFAAPNSQNIEKKFFWEDFFCFYFLPHNKNTEKRHQKNLPNFGGFGGKNPPSKNMSRRNFEPRCWQWHGLDSRHLRHFCQQMGGNPKRGVGPQIGGFISWKTLLKWMMWGENPLFSETPNCWNRFQIDTLPEVLTAKAVRKVTETE